MNDSAIETQFGKARTHEQEQVKSDDIRMLGCACRRESGHTSTTFDTDTDKGMARTLWLCSNPHPVPSARDKDAPLYYTDQTWTEKHGGLRGSIVNQTTNTSPLSRGLPKTNNGPTMHQKQDKPNWSSDMHQWISHAEGGCIQKSKKECEPCRSRFLVEHNRVKKGINQKKNQNAPRSC